MAEGLEEVISLRTMEKIHSLYEISKNRSPWTEAGPVSFNRAERAGRLAS